MPQPPQQQQQSQASDGSAIEVYEASSNTWSIFASELSTPQLLEPINNNNNNSTDTATTTTTTQENNPNQLPVIRKFFKLKISIF